jgi:osmoprotectant transport system ATP-binding protein
MIEISGLTKRYDDFTAVDHVDLDVADGEFAVLLGPSGSGKTTILRMVNRMVEPTSGTVRIGGRDTAELKPEQLRRSMGYVIQNTGLFPNMTIHKNVATVPHLLGWDRKRIDSRVDELLDLVGLDPDTYGPKRPSQLSGGEAQRVGVARALAADPPVLLMDEPFGAVDPLTRERLQHEMKRLQEKVRKTILFVTHDIDEAVLLADRVALLRGGVLQQFSAPELMWREPANEFVRSFFGENLGLRIMARHCLSSVKLDPLPEGLAIDAMPHVDASSTLKEALAELVGSRAERVVVVDGERALGTFGFDDLVRALGEGSESQGLCSDDGSDTTGADE